MNASTLAHSLPTPTLPSPQGGGLTLLAWQRAHDVDHPGDVVAAETHVHKALIERHDAIEDRRRYSNAVGEVADHIEIMLQRRHRTLHRLEAALRHPRRTDAELGRAARAGGDRLDHCRYIDTGFQPERHCLRGGGDVDRDQKVVDQLDAARGA